MRLQIHRLSCITSSARSLPCAFPRHTHPFFNSFLTGFTSSATNGVSDGGVKALKTDTSVRLGGRRV